MRTGKSRKMREQGGGENERKEDKRENGKRGEYA